MTPLNLLENQLAQIAQICVRVLRQLFDKPFMEAGDNFWFFFSGHGIRYADRDYLMPCDGDPEDIENTAIAINFVAVNVCVAAVLIMLS